MGNIFSNKSFMNRYFSAPKSTGPGKMDPMHNGEPGVQKEDFNQFSGPAKNGKDGRDGSLYGTLKEGIKSVPNTLKTLVNIGTKSKSEIDATVKKKLKEKGRNDRSKYKGPAKTDPTKKMTKAEIKASIDKQKPIESKKTGKPVKETSEKAIKLALKAKLDKEKPVESKKTGNGPAKKKADGTKMTKGEKQADRASKKSTRKKKRAEKRIDRNEKKQDRISKNTSKSTDPEVVKSGQARIERAKKRVKKNKTVSPDYVSKKDKANIAKNKKNEPGLKNPPPSSQTKTPLSAGDGGDDFNKLLSPAKTDPLLSDMQEALQNPKVYKKGKRKGLRKAKKLAKK